MAKKTTPPPPPPQAAKKPTRPKGPTAAAPPDVDRVAPESVPASEVAAAVEEPPEQPRSLTLHVSDPNHKVIAKKAQIVGFPLTDEEFIEHANQLALTEGEIHEEEEYAKGRKAELKDRMTVLTSKRTSLAKVVRTRCKEFEVEVTHVADYEAGVVRELMPDGTLHRERPLTTDEMQQPLFGIDGGKVDDPIPGDELLPPEE